MFSLIHSKKIVGSVVLMLCMSLFGTITAPAFAAERLENAASKSVQNFANGNADDPALGQRASDAGISCGFGWTDNSSMTGCVAVLMSILMWLTGMLLYYAGLLLNFAVIETVVKMGENFDGLLGIYTAWEVLRDIGNVVFVFAVIFIGLATILQVNRYSYKQLLRNVIIGALLINFSLLIGKVVIDVTNLAAAAIYDRSIPNATQCTSAQLTTQEAVQGCIDAGIAGSFMTQLKLTTFFSSTYEGGLLTMAENAGVTASQKGALQKIIMVGFMASIFFVVTAFVFFAGAVMLIGRFVILIFLLIFSPIAFVGMAFPKLGGYASKWWDKLFSQAFFAPVYFLMIYVTLQVLRTPVMSGATNSNTFADALITTSGRFDVVLNFAVVIGLMLLALIVSAQMGAYAGNALLSWGKNTTKAFVGATAGAAAAGSLGSIANKFGREYDRINAAINTSRTGRIARRVVSAGSLGLLSDRAITSGVKSVQNKKFLGGESYAEQKKWKENRKKEQNITSRETDHEIAVKHVTSPTFQNELKSADPKVREAALESQRKVRAMSGADTVKYYNRAGLSKAEKTAFLAGITSPQLDALFTNKDDIDDDERAEIHEIRYGEMLKNASEAYKAEEEARDLENQAVRATGATQTTLLSQAAAKRATAETHRASITAATKNMSNQELENLYTSGRASVQQLSDLSPSLSGGMWNKVSSSEKIAPGTRDELSKVRYREFYNALQSAAATRNGADLSRFEQQIGKMDPGALAGMPDATVFNVIMSDRELWQAFARALKPAQVKKLTDENKLSPSDRNRVRNYIDSGSYPSTKYFSDDKTVRAMWTT